jgi:DNA ligase-1
VSLNVLGEVETTSSKNEKDSILKANNKNKELADLLDAALNFERKFFIKKFDMPGTGVGATHGDFMSLLNQLENRVVTGHAARDAVVSFFSDCDEEQQLWYKRVLFKDLKSGFTESTANKAGFKIPVFKVKLAKDKKECKKLEAMLAAGGFRSRKYDGYRLVGEIIDGFCTLLSRNGTVYKNFPMINEALEELYPTGKHMVDGEIMSNDFQSIQKSAFAEKRGSVVGDMVFMIFDSVPWDEWESKKFKTKASDRFAAMEKFHTDNPHPLVEIVEHEFGVWTEDEMMAFRDQSIAAGFEGEMWEPNIPYYVGKKSNKMLKFKKMKSMDVIIKGFYEGKEDTKLEGSLGGFVVEQEDGKECEVGTLRNLTHEDRQLIWDNQDDFLEMVFEAEYQEIASKGKMRFPVFIRWRDDKS